MIGHQTIANQQYPVQFQALSQQIQINAAMGIVVENKPASIAALLHVVRKIQTDYASQTSHVFLPCCKIDSRQKTAAPDGEWRQNAAHRRSSQIMPQTDESFLRMK
jgi:hypothetical protein